MTSLLVFLLIALTPWQAGAEILVKQGQDGARSGLKARAALLGDPGGTLTIKDVAAPGMAEKFAPYDGKLIEQVGSTAKKWLRLRVMAGGKQSAAMDDWVLEVGLPDRELIQLYAPDPKNRGAYLRLDIPDGAIGRTRLLPYPRFACRLAVEHGQWTTYYVRLSTFGPTVISLMLWQENLFLRNAYIQNLLFGLLYGIMFCMVCYNLFLFLSLRRGIYAVYVAFIFTILCYSLVLAGHAGVLLGMPCLYLQTAEWFLLGASIYFSAVFCKKFLGTARYMPRLHRGLVFFQGMALAVIALGLAGADDAAAWVATVLGMVGPVYVLILGLVRWRQGFDAAKFYLLASFSFIVGTLVFISWTLNLLPTNYSGELLFTIGPALESVLLSFALADYIKSLEKEKSDLAVSRARYKRASQLDGLTQLFNKKYFLERLESMARDSAENGQSLSFAILDVDDFKLLNDAHGHQAGDKVLQSLAEVIKNELRGPDIAGRYGGEEFTLAFPDSTSGQALNAAERIRGSFASLEFSFAEAKGVKVTLSLGLAQLVKGESPAGMIQRADQALYRAKEQGKNRIALAS